MDREMFISDVQQDSKLCAPLHFSYTIEPLSSFQQMPVRDVLGAICRQFNICSSPIVHRSSLQQIVISFSHHFEALSAQQFVHDNAFIYVKGCRYRLTRNDSPLYCRRVFTNQRVVLKLRKLPLHMWTGRAVEQILSPYCAVDYVEPSTRAMDDLSLFVCMARSRRNMPIPSKIQIVTAVHCYAIANKNLSVPPLHTQIYEVIIERSEFMLGVTQNYPYEAVANSGSDGTEICTVYASPSTHTQKLAQNFSSAVILTVTADSYYATLPNVCQAIQDSSHLRIHVKLLDYRVYLLYFSQTRNEIDLYSYITPQFRDAVLAGQLKFERWTPAYGSVSSTLDHLIDLTLVGIPCNLCTPLIIEQVLSTFALVHKHQAATSWTLTDGFADAETVHRYHCSVWCSTPQVIPHKILAYLLPTHLANHEEISKVVNAICSVIEISMYTDQFSD